MDNELKSINVPLSQDELDQVKALAKLDRRPMKQWAYFVIKKAIESAPSFKPPRKK